jgi:hypothetical protein
MTTQPDASLRDRIAETLYAHDHPSYLVPLNETGMGPAYRESADAVLAVLPSPADQAALARVRTVLETEAVVGRSALDYRGLITSALMADEAQPAETDEQRADREETERDHAKGDHTHCGPTCQVEYPTEQLRNFILAKGYPGTAGMLDELLRRAAMGARP